MKKRARLGDIAEVLRCQLSRKEISESEISQNGWVHGLYPDNWSIVLEAGIEHYDQDTGFILNGQMPVPAMPSMQMKLTPKNQKYLLKKDDILWSCIAGLQKIARPALIVREPGYAVNARNLCIIRAHSCNVLWLFYLLREDYIRNELLKHLVKAKALNISVEALRNLELCLPSESTLEAIKVHHEKILTNFLRWKNIREENLAEKRAIHSAIEFDKHIEEGNKLKAFP